MTYPKTGCARYQRLRTSRGAGSHEYWTFVVGLGQGGMFACVEWVSTDVLRTGASDWSEEISSAEQLEASVDGI